VCYISTNSNHWINDTNNIRWNVELMRPQFPVSSSLVCANVLLWTFQESPLDVTVIGYEHILRYFLLMTYFILLPRTEHLKAWIKWNVLHGSTYCHVIHRHFTCGCFFLEVTHLPWHQIRISIELFIHSVITTLSSFGHFLYFVK
jgi:hypothetical protein